MTTYTLRNLRQDTSRHDQQKLEASLNKVEGLSGVKITPERRQVSFDHSGTAPTFDSIRKACSDAGFQVESQG